MALTRAKNWLYVCNPLRYYHSYRPGVSDRFGMAQRTRFLPDKVIEYFDQQIGAEGLAFEDDEEDMDTDTRSHGVRRRTKDLWS